MSTNLVSECTTCVLQNRNPVRTRIGFLNKSLVYTYHTLLNHVGKSMEKITLNESMTFYNVPTADIWAAQDLHGLLTSLFFITKTRLFKYVDKKSDIFIFLLKT